MPSELRELLAVLAELPDDVLWDCYELSRSSKAPLDEALFAWRDAGCPVPLDAPDV